VDDVETTRAGAARRAASLRRMLRTRDLVLTYLTAGALLEIAWTVYLGWRLPRHYVANHWDWAWVGLDIAQVGLLLAAAWAAWRRRAVLIVFAVGSGTLLLVDAWFDVTTARYADLDQSLLLLIGEVPGALVLFWIAWRVMRLLTSSDEEASHSQMARAWRSANRRS